MNDIFSLTFPNGFVIEQEDCLCEQYVNDRKIAEKSGDLLPLIEKWKYLCGSLIGKTEIDNDVLIPPELLRLTLLSKQYGVPEGVVLFQIINSGKWFVKNGFVVTNPS